MTREQHIKRIRQIAFELEKADHGMGMPRDAERVRHLRDLLERARRDASDREVSRWIELNPPQEDK